MCDEGFGVPYNAGRAERLKQLCAQLSLDAIVLITGFDGCYSLESKGLVEWLCECASAPTTDFRTAALEEGLFVAMPQELAWHVDQDTDSIDADTVDALDRLLADPSAAADTSAQSMDVDMPSTTFPPAAAAGHAASAAVVSNHLQQMQQSAHDADSNYSGQVDGKLSLLLQLRPQLRRVGIALGVEVRGGVQQQVPLDNIYRWPLLMAAAERLDLPLEHLFQEIVDITHTLRPLLGQLDGTLLSTTLRLRRPLLTRSWLECMSVCGRRSPTPKLDLTEATIAAPITEFVSGCGCRLKPGQYQPLALPPRVLFGTRTSHHEALSCAQTSLRSQAARQGTAVLHATVEAADACSPLRVARTIFFSQGAAAAETGLQLRLNALQQQLQGQQQQQQDVEMSGCGSPAAGAAAAGCSSCHNQPPAAAAVGGCDEHVQRCDSGIVNNGVAGGCSTKQQQQQQQQLLQALPVGQALAGGDFEVDLTDLFDLMCWYWSAVEAAWQCMEHYSTQEGGTWQSAQAFGTQVFWTAAAAAQLVPQQTHHQQQQQHYDQQQQQQQWPHRPQLQLQLLSWDGGPRPMPSGTNLEQHNGRFKTLRVTVSDIRSRSSAHPGLELGNVLYMDSFVDVPSVGNCPPRLINLTLTHCPTYSFDFWGSEATVNMARVAAFRRHLQLQLQQQLQPDPKAVALRRSADDTALLRLQLQQQQGNKGSSKGSLRRSSVGPSVGPLSPQQQQQQLLLLQQMAAGGAKQQQQQQQQRQQQQTPQKVRGSSSKQEATGRGNKHQLAASGPSCCGGDGDSAAAAAAAAAVQQYKDNGNGQQAPPKRSCCGSGSATGAAALALQQQQQLQNGMLDNSDLTIVPMGVDGSNGSNGGSSASTAAAAAAAAAAAQCWRQLGRLMVPPGEMPGEVGLVLTGAKKLAVMDGPLYPHSNGLVFVSRPTRVHVLLLEHIKAVWLQDFASKMPGYPDLGPCIVVLGTQPCCGLLPALHMTDNCHIAIPLRGLSKAFGQHMVTAVLPAWQAAAGVVKSSKGAAVPWPLPAEFQPFYGYWLQGPRKRYMLPQPDDSIDQLVHALDRPQHQQQQQQQQQAQV